MHDDSDWPISTSVSPQLQQYTTQLWGATTIRPGISVNHSDIKQCLSLWLPHPTHTQITNKWVGNTIKTIRDHWLLHNWIPNEGGQISKSISYLIVPQTYKTTNTAVKRMFYTKSQACS